MSSLPGCLDLPMQIGVCSWIWLMDAKSGKFIKEQVFLFVYFPDIENMGMVMRYVIDRQLGIKPYCEHLKHWGCLGILLT